MELKPAFMTTPADIALRAKLCLRALEILRAQSVTISKSVDEVRLQCDTPEDAELLFEWLTALSAEEKA